MADINSKTLKEIGKMLNNTMTDLLYGGAGDAGYEQLKGAATCFEVLKLLNIKIDNEEDVRSTLEGSNIYTRNFIKGL